MSFEVSEPILNSPFEKPKEYWYIQEGEEPEKRAGAPSACGVPAARPERGMDGDSLAPALQRISRRDTSWRSST